MRGWPAGPHRQRARRVTPRPRKIIIFRCSSPALGRCRGGSTLPAGRVGRVAGRLEKVTRFRLCKPLSVIVSQAHWLSISAAFIIVQRVLSLVEWALCHGTHASRFGWGSRFAESEFRQSSPREGCKVCFGSTGFGSAPECPQRTALAGFLKKKNRAIRVPIGELSLNSESANPDPQMRGVSRDGRTKRQANRAPVAQ